MCGSSWRTPERRINRRSLLAASGLAVAVGASACSADPPTRGAQTTVAAGGAPGGAPPALEIVLLGTQGAPQVEPDRAGIATALVVDGITYVIDCGRGATTQFSRAGLKFKSLKSIFITHLHADHVADYYNFFMQAGLIPDPSGDILPGPINVYGPGPAGGLPPKFGGGIAPTIAPQDPTPGIATLTERCHEAYAYNSNIFMRDSGANDIQDYALVREIVLPKSGANFKNTSPPMRPFHVMEDDKVRVSAVLVPHGQIFPSFAYRFDTTHGSVTFSGDTTYSENLVTLAKGSDVLVHEAVNLRGSHAISPAVLNHTVESHVEVQKVGPIAQRTGAHKLILTHLIDLVNHPLDSNQWKNWAQEGYDGQVIIGQDLQRIPLI